MLIVICRNNKNIQHNFGSTLIISYYLQTTTIYDNNNDNIFYDRFYSTVKTFNCFQKYSNDMLVTFFFNSSKSSSSISFST